MGMLGRSLYRGAVYVSHSANLDSRVRALKALAGATIARRPNCPMWYGLYFSAVV